MPAGSTAPAVLAAVAVGGALGSATRYGLAVLWPTPSGSFPWTTLLTNLLGCALIGLLMQLVAVRADSHRLLRPFLGAGLLGGFTTFSSYALETRALLAAGHLWLAGGYLLGTLCGAVLAVSLGMATGRAVAPLLAAEAP